MKDLFPSTCTAEETVRALGDFIEQNLQPVLHEWAASVRVRIPAAATMSVFALHDPAEEMLVAMAKNMRQPQSWAQEFRKFPKSADLLASDITAASLHGAFRHLSGFDFGELVSEFSILRATILRLWRNEADVLDGVAFEELTQFNESIDQALAESVASYSIKLDESRDTSLAGLGHNHRSPFAALNNCIKLQAEPIQAIEPLCTEMIALQLDNERRVREAEAALLDEQEIGRLREEFIAVLGHDLRNPLSAIATAAELLVRGPFNSEIAKVGSRMRSASDRMARLIDDVVDFARGRLGGGLGVNLPAVDSLQAAISEVVDELRCAHPGRIVLDDVVIDQAVHCDCGRIQQLVSNLVGNALTHGEPREPVTFDAKVEHGWLVMSVWNKGEPIEPQNLDKVFEPYWRPADSRLSGGLGLGLYICARIVKEHAGLLEVTSTREGGTHFTAKIPAGPGTPAA